MSDDDDDDYSGDELDFGWEHDYAYIDESYDLADELAERTCPSPPPYTEEELQDYDPFDYFHDVEDGTAGYFDVDWPAQSLKPKSEATKAGQKRKAASTPNPRQKKRVGKDRAGVIVRQRSQSPTPAVLWRSQDARRRMADSATKPFVAGIGKPYALLKDWRTELGNNIEVTTEEVELELGSPPGGGTDSEADGKRGIDAAALQAALQDRLTSANPALQGLDNSMLLQYALRMLSGQDTDGLVDELTENVLGGRPDDEISAQEDESEHETIDIAQDRDCLSPKKIIEKDQTLQPLEKVACAEDKLDEISLSNSASSTTYPKTRTNAVSQSRRKTDTDTDKAEKSRPQVKTSGRKRKAPTPQPDDGTAPSSKRKAPSYAAPTATSKARTRRSKP